MKSLLEKINKPYLYIKYMSSIGKHINTIILVIIGGFLLYWLFFVLSPSVEMSAESKAKIDSLNNNIKKYEEENKKIDSVITQYNHEIERVNNNITRIKNEKTIVKEIYHEKIISIDTFNRSQIDEFFSNRYNNR
jgi:hypothetical protein